MEIDSNPDKIHAERHALSIAFDNMQGTTFSGFLDSTKRIGIQSPNIYVAKGGDGSKDNPFMVLDGWHRWLAAVEQGTTDSLEAVTVPEEDAFEFVMAQNFHRRHLSAKQRADAMVRAANWVGPGGTAITNPVADIPDSVPALTTEEMAKASKTSVAHIARAKQRAKTGEDASQRHEAKRKAEAAANPPENEGAPPQEPPETCQHDRVALPTREAIGVKTAAEAQLYDLLAEAHGRADALEHDNKLLQERVDELEKEIAILESRLS